MSDREYSSVDNDEERLKARFAAEKPQSGNGDKADEGDRVAWLPAAPLLYRVVKRSIDIVLSALMLLLMSPALLVIAIAIKLSSAGPVILRQERLGYRGKRFNIIKFRTMRSDYDRRRDHDAHKKFMQGLISEKYGPPGETPQFKVRFDRRITPIGQFLRRTSLDEVPQLLNVLLGDMSLVGPRPPIPYEWAAYQQWHKLRLSGKPGITGLWQVEGRAKTTFDQMVNLDIGYIEHPSILQDLRILFATPIAVVRGDKAF